MDVIKRDGTNDHLMVIDVEGNGIHEPGPLAEEYCEKLLGNPGIVLEGSSETSELIYDEGDGNHHLRVFVGTEEMDRGIILQGHYRKHDDTFQVKKVHMVYNPDEDWFGDY